MIVRGRREGSAARTALAAAAAVALAVAACEAPAPTGLRPEGRAPDAPAAQLSPAGSVRTLVTEAAAGEPLVFIDGQRAPEGIPRSLDPAEIDRIEVVKGAAATALYGPDAADGVINIFTKGSAAAGEDAPAKLRPVSEDAAEREVAGVLLRRSGSMDAVPPKLSVYLDGEPFAGTLSSIDPETIDRVEVVKGGAADGSDVVRVITKKAARGGGEE